MSGAANLNAEPDGQDTKSQINKRAGHTRRVRLTHFSRFSQNTMTPLWKKSIIIGLIY